MTMWNVCPKTLFKNFINLFMGHRGNDLKYYSDTN